MIDVIDNRLLKKRGVWVRPDPEEHGCKYEKLQALGYPDQNCLSWMSSMGSQFTTSQKSHVLTFDKVMRAWKMYEADAADDLLALRLEPRTGKWMFMAGDINSFNEPLEARDLVWSRLPSVQALLEARPAEDIVWQVKKLWTHDSKYATSETCEKELWLDNVEAKFNGDYVWTSSRKSKELDGCSIVRRASESGLPYETVHWTIDIPCMFQFPTQALAMHGARSLLLSYIDNSPLEVKWCIADAFTRAEYEQTANSWDSNRSWPNGLIVPDKELEPRYMDIVFGLEVKR